MDLDQKKLIETYEGLEPLEKSILQLLIVLFEPINRTEFVSLIAKAGIRGDKGKALTYSALRPKFEAWKKLGLIESSTVKGRIFLGSPLQDYVFQDAFYSENYNRFKDAVASRYPYRSYRGRDYWDLTELREAFFKGDEETWNRLFSRASSLPVLLDPFRAEAFARLPEVSKLIFARWEIYEAIAGRETGLDAKAYAILAETLEGSAGQDVVHLEALLDLYIARGDIEGIKSLQSRAPQRAEISAVLAFLKGDYETSSTHFEAGLKQLRRRTRRRTAVFEHFPTFFYAALLLKQGTTDSLKKLKSAISQIDKWDNGFRLFSLALSPALDKVARPMDVVSQFELKGDAFALLALTQGWVWRWCFRDSPATADVKNIADFGEYYRRKGLSFLAAECEAISAVVSKGAAARKLHKSSSAFHEQAGTVSLIDFIQPAPMWAKALDAIEKLVGELPASGDPSGQDQPLHDQRMIWELTAGGNFLSVEPFIQKLSKKGWTKGRKVALERIYRDPSQFDFLSEQDQAICRALREDIERNYYGYHETTYYFDASRLSKAIVGHPLIFYPGDRATPLEISRAEPELTIEKTQSNIRFEISPSIDSGSFSVIGEGGNRISIVEFSSKQQELSKLVASMPPIPVDQDKSAFRADSGVGDG